MKLILTESQVRELINKINSEELEEQDSIGVDPEDSKPKSGASEDQAGGEAPAGGTSKSDGYPEVHVWESGASHGANPPGNTKWPSAGQQPKRDKANTLN